MVSELNLTNDNYYSNESSFKFLSKSVYFDFKKCEAKALAKLKGEFEEQRSQIPLLVGNYLHSYFESEESHYQFLEEHQKEIYKYGNKEKGIKTDFKVANRMINALVDEDSFNKVYQGDKEVIVTGEIDRVKWKGKIDCLNLERGIFLDLKTVADIHGKYWNEAQHQYVNFAINGGYLLQMAIYQELIKQTFGKVCQPFIIAVSKQDIPDKAIFSIPQSILDSELDSLEMNQDHIANVINGEEKPKRCEKCDYCRSTKELKEITSIMDIQIY